MLRRLLPGALAAALFLLAPAAQAEEILVEGEAPVLDGNVALAREQAIRNALADAARRSSFSIATSLGLQNGEVGFDQAVVKSAANVHRHQVVGERLDGKIYRVSLRAELEAAAGRGAGGVCREGHVKRLLIGGFPVLHPEELRRDELSGYARLTAGEIGKRFSANPAVMVDYDGNIMVHRGEPERVVGSLPADAQAWKTIRAEAEKHRAQYLLVGAFRSLAHDADKKRRQVDIEAFILDARSGSCVARRRFAREAEGRVVLPTSISFGSPAHYDTDLGRAYGDVLTEIADWAEATASCQPFSARVIKVQDKLVYLDAGAEQGLAVGDHFSAFKAAEQPVTTLGGEILGLEKRPAGELRVTTVYPRFAIGEFLARPAGAALAPGDELYSR